MSKKQYVDQDGQTCCKTKDTGKQKREQLPSEAGKEKAKTIVFFGNSLTAGYGVDPSEAFPALVQEKIDSMHLPYKVVNAGLSGETTAGGKSRIDWILRQPVDIFVLELGIGVGLFARFFLDAFRERCQKEGRDYYERLTYIAADRSERERWSDARCSARCTAGDSMCARGNVPRDPTARLRPTPPASWMGRCRL